MKIGSADFLGRRSLIGESPVLERQGFPFLDAFEAALRKANAMTEGTDGGAC